MGLFIGMVTAMNIQEFFSLAEVMTHAAIAKAEELRFVYHMTNYNTV